LIIRGMMMQDGPGPAATGGKVNGVAFSPMWVARVRHGAFALAAAALPCHSQAADETRNWFDDPFFQVSSAIADCPLPAGPFITQAERAVQAHHRAEKGTTCWLAGQCDRPNAHAYDGDIAAAFKAAWPGDAGLHDSTLWVTVQGRVVYIEGCIGDMSAVPRLEAFARRLPHVQQAVAIVRGGAGARVPYKLRGMIAPGPSPAPNNPRPP
jgi:hypothetical protein